MPPALAGGSLLGVGDICEAVWVGESVSKRTGVIKEGRVGGVPNLVNGSNIPDHRSQIPANPQAAPSRINRPQLNPSAIKISGVRLFLSVDRM